MKLLTVSANPHVRDNSSTTAIMRDVIIALVPALIAAIVIFGVQALLVTLVCVVAAVLAEFIWEKAMKLPVTIGDLSAVVTGVLLAYCLPSTIPLWMAALGSVIAIIVVKQLFGGIGCNFANPAATARIVLSCPSPPRWPASPMTVSPAPLRCPASSAARVPTC